MWMANGATWFFGQPPEHWNPWMQLIRAGFDSEVQRRFRLELVTVRLAAKPITMTINTSANNLPVSVAA
jgi:hypothetical protein